jgi:dTDP-4-dehydrorhamnose 3,5-epimerase
MHFVPTPVPGAFIIELDKREDERGFFARVYCEREFATAGLDSHFVQVNNSLSKDRGTLRGMHYQLGEAAEVKVVRCLRGALWDAILDLRPESETFGQSFGAELTAENRLMMYVPRGFAHGLMTLEENTEALYLVSTFYDPARERCVRWNDPRFAIAWPEAPLVISEKDAQQRDFDPVWHLAS